VNGFLGAFKVGELRKSENQHGKYIYITFSNKPIWSSRNHNNWVDGVNMGKLMKGLHRKNYDFLMKKINSI